jgi:hypothetical protein
MIYLSSRRYAKLGEESPNTSSQFRCLAYPLVRFPRIFGALLTDHRGTFFTPSVQNRHVITYIDTHTEQKLHIRIKLDLAPRSRVALVLFF